MRTIGGAKTIGPLLIGLGLPIEIAPLRSSANDILNLASVAAYSAEIIDYKNKKKTSLFLLKSSTKIMLGITSLTP